MGEALAGEGDERVRGENGEINLEESLCEIQNLGISQVLGTLRDIGNKGHISCLLPYSTFSPINK